MADGEYVSHAVKEPDRRLRADAKRNEDAVLDAAKALFAEVGVDAPVRQIAERAGVGMGTLYRRFPKRADLVAAVLRREIDACAADASAYSVRYPPGEALIRWLRRYSEFIAAKRGLSAVLRSGDPTFDTLPQYFRVSFEPALVALLRSAAAAGEVRSDIPPYDLLRAIGNLTVSEDAEGQEHTQRIINLLYDGLRVTALGRIGESDS